MNMVIDEDDKAVLADQRALSDSWSKNSINRTVLVGTPIYLDSNASIKDKRPQYFNSTEGDRDSCLPPRVSVNMTSLRSYTIEPNATDVKLCVYTARDVLGGECQVLHTSRAFIYTKMLEDALQTPLPMRLYRQHLSIDLFPN